jgi:hypothetical protein
VCLTTFYVNRARIAHSRDGNVDDISVVIWTSLVQQLAWDCMSKAERSCDNLTHSWRASSSVPAECPPGHTVCHRLHTDELAEEIERPDTGRWVS